MKNSKKSALLKFLACVGMALTILGVMIAFQANTTQAADGPKTYTITYNANGGTGAPEGQVKVHDVTLILPEQIPTREGYAFRGWSTTTHPEIIYPAGAEYTANRGAKFYAIWDVNEYTIRYNANGGYGAPDTQKKIKNEPLTLSSKKPYRKGYEFKGWSTTTHPDVLYSAGAEYLNNYGANFYAIWTPLPRPEDENSGFNKITLSGDPDDHIITDRYCYIEGEKFFLLLDKDLDLPGDFADNVALIMDKLEELTGLSYMDPVFQDTGKIGYGPWENFQYGRKVVISVNVDREAEGYISGALADEAFLYLTGLISPELWDSDPMYSEKIGGDDRFFVDYFTIAHELTHTLTLRKAKYSKIMAEGIADYLGLKALEEMPGYSEDFDRSLEYTLRYKHGIDYCYDHNFRSYMTEENAEQVFLMDFVLPEVDQTDKPQYYYGRYLYTYLFERFGMEAVQDYSDALWDSGFMTKYRDIDLYGGTTPEIMAEYCALIKGVFGSEIFKEFSAWYLDVYSQNIWFKVNLSFLEHLAEMGIDAETYYAWLEENQG